MTPRLALFTLCRDRIEYTRTCLTRLWQTNHPMPEHLVIDNGSTDGTPRWLREEQVTKPWMHLIENDQNRGIAGGTHQAILHFRNCTPRPDILIKVDNDCYVRSTEILAAIQLIYRVLGNTPAAPQFILSPSVSGINNQPTRRGAYRVLDYTLAYSGIIGGIFQCVPFWLYDEIILPPTLRPAYGQDTFLCHEWYKRGHKMAYIEELDVEHFETTDGQAARYPWYFERRRKENQT